MTSTTIDINTFKLQPELNIWKTVKALGNGSFGEVVLEKNTDGEHRALKKIAGSVAQTPMLKREIEILIQVKKCPDLFVQSLGWYESSDSRFTYIALEYMDKGDLGKYLAAHGPQTEANAKEIIRQLLQGLEYLHKNNICHRDMKPENVLMASQSPLRVKLTDFGASKICSENTNLHTKIGTMRYMAPELLGVLPSKFALKNGVYSNAVDLWSLGCLTYQICTLKTPFTRAGSLSSISTEYDSTYTMYDDEENVGAEEDMTLMSKFCHGEASLPIEDLKSVRLSDEGIQFIKDLLLPYPPNRMSAANAAKSLWLSEAPMDRAEATRIQLQELGLPLSYQVVSRMIQHWENSRGKAGPGRMKLDIPKLPHSIRQDATAFMHAAAEKSYATIVGIMSCLIEPKKECFDFRIKGTTTLELAAKGGHIEVAKILLENGANINASPPYNALNGRTALQAAAESGNLEMVELLLEKGANINAKPSELGGRGALQAAIEGSQYEIAILLLQKGANVNLPPATINGRTALQLAAERGELKLMELLLSKGAQVNAEACESGGRTALQAAAGNGNLEIAEMLLKKGAKVDEEPSEECGRTALQAAAEKGHLDMVKLLLRMGANVNAEPSEDQGVTALAAARKGKHSEVVEVLRAAGAKS